MERNVEAMFDKLEMQYIRGFYDCASMFIGYLNAACDRVEDKGKRFGVLVEAIEYVYSLTAQEIEDKVKKQLGILWEIKRDAKLETVKVKMHE